METPPKIERGPRNIPSFEEVRFMFEKFIAGRKYTELHKKEDAGGIYLWEVRLDEVNEEGLTTECLYKRAGEYPDGNKVAISTIHVAITDSEGYPVGGHSAFRYINGEWVETV